jgi:hypothetical protein
MMRFKAVLFALTITAGLAAAPLFAQKTPPGGAGYQVGDRLAPQGGAAKAAFREISWDDLIPADWNPEGMFEELDLETLGDNDPRAIELMQKLREAWDRAPVVAGMDGQRVRIPGFVVPLETDGKTIREFLLVPYFGACIHVPPPPANQLIHVMPDKPVPDKWNMVPVWVNGILTVARFDSELGNAGYQLRGIEVEEYKEPMPR